MKVVSKEISAYMSTMAIVNAKKGALRPLSPRELLRLGLHDVQNDCYAILVIVSHDSLICVRTVGRHDAVSFGREFR